MFKPVKIDYECSCDHCGNNLYPGDSIIKRWDYNFCNLECYNEYFKEKTSEVSYHFTSSFK
jgi:hypothetical protein